MTLDTGLCIGTVVLKNCCDTVRFADGYSAWSYPMITWKLDVVGNLNLGVTGVVVGNIHELVRVVGYL
jgi:hypothetical protein